MRTCAIFANIGENVAISNVMIVERPPHVSDLALVGKLGEQIFNIEEQKKPTAIDCRQQRSLSVFYD